MEFYGEPRQLFKRKSDLEDNLIYQPESGTALSSSLSATGRNNFEMNQKKDNNSIYNLNDMIDSYASNNKKPPTHGHHESVFQQQQHQHIPLTSQNNNSNNKFNYSSLQQYLIAQQLNKDSNVNDSNNSIDSFKKLKQYSSSTSSSSSTSPSDASNLSTSPNKSQINNVSKVNTSPPFEFNPHHFNQHSQIPPPHVQPPAHLLSYHNQLGRLNAVSTNPAFMAAAAAAINNPAANAASLHGLLMNQFAYCPDPASFYMNRKDSIPHPMFHHQQINYNNNCNNNNNNNGNISKRPKSTFPFGKCKVCNDKATGIHYGIATCEGCKGFFKRSTLRKEKYRCFFGNCCPLSPENRNRCKSCRFRKCLEVGMSIQGVKMGRIPKAEKEKALMYLKKKQSGIVDDNENNVIDKENDADSINRYNGLEDEDRSQSSSNNENNNYDFEESDDVLSDDCGTGNDGNNSNNTTTFEEYYNKLNSSLNKPIPNHQSIVTQISSNLDEKSAEYYENSKVLFKNLPQSQPTNPNQTPAEHLMMMINTSNKMYNFKKSSSATSSSASSNTNLNLEDEANKSSSSPEKEDKNLKTISSETTKQLRIELDNLNIAHNNTSNKEENEVKKGENEQDKENIIQISASTSTINKESVSNQIMKYSYKTLENTIKSGGLQFQSVNNNDTNENMGIRSLFDLLKMHKTFQNSNLTINRYHSNAFSSNVQLDYSYHIILSLISDKVYQAHIENNDRIAFLYERALKLIKENVREFEGHDASLHEVWNSLLESIPQVVKNFISFAKEVPGLNEISSKDFTTMVNNRLFDYFILKHSPLFIEGESYMMLPNNIQYSKSWLLKVVGEEMTNALFEFSEELNSLNMTTKEIALLIPYVLTVPDQAYEDSTIIANLHEYFYRAILYEFDLNRRNNVFITKWKKLLDKMPELNELQINKIGSLTPKYFVKFVELYRVPFQTLLHKLESLGNFCKNIKKKYFLLLLNSSFI